MTKEELATIAEEKVWNQETLEFCETLVNNGWEDYLEKVLEELRDEYASHLLNLYAQGETGDL